MTTALKEGATGAVSGTVGLEGATGAGVSAGVAWWRAARRLLRSWWAGPRRRGGRGGWGGGVGWRKGEPGCPRLTLRALLVTPPVVVRVREAVPPATQTATNSSREARRERYLCLSILKAGSSQDHLLGFVYAIILGGKGDIRRAGGRQNCFERCGPGGDHNPHTSFSAKGHQASLQLMIFRTHSWL